MYNYSTRKLRVKFTFTDGVQEYTNLHMSIKVVKSTNSIPNQAEIEVFNFNSKTRSKFFGIYEKDKASIKCEIYYDDSLMFKGEVVNSLTKYTADTGEYHTTLWCGDGYSAFNQFHNKTYDKGSDKLSIADQLAKEAGLAMGTIGKMKDCFKSSLLKKITKDGKILDNIKTILNNGCGGEEIELFVEDGLVNIGQKSTPIIEKIEKITGGLLEAPKLSEQGININLLLRTDVKLGTLVAVDTTNFEASVNNGTVFRVDSNLITGVGQKYKVIQITHTLDNFSNSVAKTNINGVLIH